jgi:hypothetical protein
MMEETKAGKYLTFKIGRDGGLMGPYARGLRTRSPRSLFSADELVGRRRFGFIPK